MSNQKQKRLDKRENANKRRIQDLEKACSFLLVQVRQMAENQKFILEVLTQADLIESAEGEEKTSVKEGQTNEGS